MQPRRLLPTGTIISVVLGLILGVLNTPKAEAQFNIAGIYIVARSPEEGPSRILKINADGTLVNRNVILCSFSAKPENKIVHF